MRNDRTNRFTFLSVRLLLCMLACFSILQSPATIHATGSDVYVDDYGAVPDDAGDDGPAIRAAIQAAKAAGTGSRVMFSQGKYVVSPPPKAWDFDTNGSLDGWVLQHDLSGGTVSGGILTLTVSGTDPYLLSPNNLNIDSRIVKSVRIKMKNHTSGTAAQLYWITDDDPVWNAGKRLDFTVVANDANYTEYTLNLSGSASWAGVIRQIRIDPEQGAGTGTIEIDDIRVDVLPDKVWGFDTDGDFENWSLISDLSGSVSGGSMSLSVTGFAPYLNSPDNLGMPTAYRYVKIRMKNNTPSTVAYFYWKTESDPVFDSKKRIQFQTKPNDSGYTEYVIDAAPNIFWTGKIKQIRIDPVHGYDSGSIDFDSVSMEASPLAIINYNFVNQGMKGISFVGDQTEIAFTDGLSGGFALRDGSEDVSFQGLTIDYTTPPFVQGSITAVDASAGTFDFLPDAGYSLLDDPAMADIPTHWSTVRDSSNPALEKKTASLVFVNSWEKIDSTTYRMTVAAGSKPLIGASGQLESGDKLIINNRGHGNHAIWSINSSDISIEDVTIYASPGAAIVGSNTDGITVDHLQVLRRPGSGRYASTNADGVHVQSARTGPIVTDSVFEGLLDDAMNIYSRPGAVVDVLSDTEVVINGRAPEAGDEIQIFDPVLGRVRGTAQVAEVESNAGFAAVTLDAPIAGVAAGTTYKTADSLFNLSASGAGFRVEDTVFRESKRYGIYVKAIDGVITDNTFTDLGGAAIVVGNEPDWPEGPFAQNIEISRNTMSGVSRHNIQGNLFYAGAIIVKGNRSGNALSDELGQQNIVISDNSITHPPRNGIYIGSADNVQIIGGNTIEADASDNAFDGNITGVKVENAANVTIDGLTINDPRADLNAGIEWRSFADVATSDLNFTLASGIPDVRTISPDAPTGLTASPDGSSVVQLDWADTAGAVKYNIYRSAESGFTPSWHNRVATGVTSSDYMDDGLTSGTTYSYKVTAVNASNFESAPSAQSSGMPVGPYDWHFHTNGDFEGWVMQNQVTGDVSGDALNLTADGIDPYIHSADNLGIDASAYAIVRIRMKNNTPSTLSQLYWITDADPNWNSAKRLNFTTSANDAEYVEYVLDVSSDPNWTGTIKKLRFDPENNFSSGTVNVDYILLEP
ncbi:right-handed parallel beta-helix repeat-containing protein [Paenibacillus sp. J5C_2022]|uniref:right-handed parallel beta-helix repeat-containing protein n=1 Tax=Paenibacillus sp. J5C2022 TaxID=2977129 RepID=UPI0021D1BD3B|nr:right-handed parallel beta-helix repeat-containing protein [Paenibacillus sp. J5C2022]MCU6707862.1 right-handed parallel beta-helix repeat-containing protein [Paenibacillus sp. J5C2022]